MSFNLTTPREAEALVARMFLAGGPCTIEVRENKAFGDRGWLALGSINLHTAGSATEQLEHAVRRGSFEWAVPSADTVKVDLIRLLSLSGTAKDDPKLRRAMDAMASIAVRAGLQHPKFDPYAFEGMPFRRSMTVVADTSGAIQGGLDFVARYLHPAARVKVPAIVQMEIVNFADRFLSGMRAATTRPADLLIDHLMSQGGQRVLLRLELQAETEIERTFILGDPMRSAFQKEADSELQDLNLSVPVRAYADRLILESARQHRAQSNHGHQVQLLTSDQGLARMAMAEGITPLFFTAVQANDFFDRRLTGANLNPFTGALDEASLVSVLWELATAFGAARLASADGAHSLSIAAIGEGLSWSPYQSHADLLWCDEAGVPAWPSVPTAPANAPRARTTTTLTPKAEAPNRPEPKKIKAEVKHATITNSLQGKNVSTFPRINVGVALKLVDELDNLQQFGTDDAIRIAGTKNKSALDDYRRFLKSAGFVAAKDETWQATPLGQKLAIALRHVDVEEVRTLLRASPAYETLERRLEALPVSEPWSPQEFTRALTTSRTFAEITNVAIQLSGDGIYSTPNKPTAAEFATAAIRRFDDLNRGEGLVATGAWLEALAKYDGIHPEVARARLEEASVAGLLRRSTEGSTTDTRFDNHTFHALRNVAGRPVVEAVHLYRGDYLIPGKSSTSLRIEGLPA